MKFKSLMGALIVRAGDTHAVHPRGLGQLSQIIAQKNPIPYISQFGGIG